MIPITDQSWQGLSWQEQLSHSIRTNHALAASLNLEPEEFKSEFPINVPLAYLSRIEAGNRYDPLLLQVLGQAQESLGPGELSPLAEESFQKGFGMIQKYAGRILIVSTGACAINCRYCFRRHFPYEQHQPSSEDWSKIFDHVAADPTISEVILSGGDPLMLNDRRLEWIFSELNGIDHVSSIRLHTRMPVVIPARVTSNLETIFDSSRAAVVLVTHINHANEMDADVKAAVGKLRTSGVTLLNQSVLLQGINDSVAALIDLSRALNSAGILPYYLHLMDPVQGANHFDVPETTGRELIDALRIQLPGYLVPRLSKEEPFKTSKTLIA